MRYIYLPRNASSARLSEAKQAKTNREEIGRRLSRGRIARRDLTRWGLFTGAGMLAPFGGLNPFVAIASAQIPTGAPASPLIGVQPFMDRCSQHELLRSSR